MDMVETIQELPEVKGGTTRVYARLTSDHRMMIEYSLAGKKVTQIAEIMGRAVNNVSMVLNSPLAQAELARRRAELQRTTDDQLASGEVSAQMVLGRAGTKAALVMEDLLDAPDDSIRLQSAKDLLNRTYGQGASTQSAPVILNIESMQVLITALAEDRELRGERSTTAA